MVQKLKMPPIFKKNYLFSVVRVRGRGGGGPLKLKRELSGSFHLKGESMQREEKKKLTATFFFFLF